MHALTLSLTLDLVEFDHGHNSRPVLETQWVLEPFCRARALQTDHSRASPSCVSTQPSTVAANVHIPPQGAACLVPESYFSHGPLSAGAGTPLRRISRSKCDQVATALLQEQGPALNVCLSSTIVVDLGRAPRSRGRIYGRSSGLLLLWQWYLAIRCRIRIGCSSSITSHLQL